jgi:hypothetical protein
MSINLLTIYQLRVMNNLIERMRKPTPKFFAKLRNIGITLAAVGAAILAEPVELPAFVLKIAGYLTVAGSVAGTVAQAAVSEE